MTCRIFVYGLIDPSTGSYFYVGATTDGRRRVNRHATDGSIEQDLIYNPAKAGVLLSLSLRPWPQRPFDLAILEGFDTEADLWRDRDGIPPEEYWIRKLKAEGHTLTNIAPGGRVSILGREYSEAECLQRRNRQLGKKHLESTKRKIAAAEAMRDPKTRARGVGHGRSKLTDAIVRDARNSKETTSALARKYGVAIPVMRHARSGKTWAHVN